MQDLATRADEGLEIDQLQHGEPAATIIGADAFMLCTGSGLLLAHDKNKQVRSGAVLLIPGNPQSGDSPVVAAAGSQFRLSAKLIR